MNTVQELATSRHQFAREQSRSRILAAARELLSKTGLQKFSMRALAKSTDCAVGSIYLHFRSKDEVFESLADEAFERLFELESRLCQRHQDGDARLLLNKAMYTYIEFGLAHAEEYNWAILCSDWPRQEERLKPVLQVFREVVGRCMLGERNSEGDIAVQALWASLHGVTSLLIQRPDYPWALRSKLIERVIHAAVDGLVGSSAATLAAVV